MPNLEIIPAMPADAPILANLLELYVHDFSEFHNLQIGEDGRFGYPPLPLYWSEPDRHPFLAKIDAQLTGLVLVKKAAGVWDMAEFFVLRGYRRGGIGTRMAHEIWTRFPGPWEVRVMQKNIAAQHFWAAAIAKFAGPAIRPTSFEKAGNRWILFSFSA